MFLFKASTPTFRTKRLLGMEVCIDSVESAIAAENGGAARMELCSNLLEGGTTPSIGMLKVVKSKISIPVFVMIRPRGGDFLYTPLEYDVMHKDLMELKQAGADGFVFGILNELLELAASNEKAYQVDVKIKLSPPRDGTVDIERCRDLIDIARPLPVTFHRAIDMTKDIFQALETVISLGCERVLTSGGDSSVLEGLPVITEMVEMAKERITVVPGGGITDRNIGRILEQSGAQEFHASARSARESGMNFRKTHISMGASFSPPEFSVKVADASKVKTFISLAKEVS